MAPNCRQNFALTVYLRPDDQRVLKARALARGMYLSTYVAALVRSHLTNQAPLPQRELTGLMQALGELRAIGRNLNQIARAVNPGAPPSGPSRDDLLAILKACEVLREHVRDLIAANLKAWENGYAKTSRRR